MYINVYLFDLIICFSLDNKLNTLLKSVEYWKLDRWSLETFSRGAIFKYVSFIFVSSFRRICGPQNPLTCMTKYVKVILESIHLILLLFSLLEKLLLISRQWSIFSQILNVSYYASKDILFQVLVAEVFPYHSLIHPSHARRMPALCF